MEFEDIKETGNPEKYMSKIISMVVRIQCALLGLNIALHECIGCLLSFILFQTRKKIQTSAPKAEWKEWKRDRERERKERVWVNEGECECHREKEREKE